jgi:DNA-directed RNA polymerase subunit RPC12/RpoP
MSSSNETRTLIELMYEIFPKCPVCGHDYAYDFSRKTDETYARCRLCGTKWLLRLKDGELKASKISAETRLLGDAVTTLGLILLSLGTIIVFLLDPLLGLFFVVGGIAMTLMGVTLPPRKKVKKEKPEKELEEKRLCPQCNKEISKVLKICPYCRFNFKSVCPSCGKRISPRFKLCPYCRKKLKK